MSLLPRIGVAAAAYAVLAAALAGPAIAAPAPSAPSAGALFVQTDGLAGNAVVAYDRRPDGTLSRGGTYPTGGLGGALAGSVVDHLASQGSLAYDRRARLLYAVNAGSGTLTVFRVRGDRLVRTEVAPTAGRFPVSVAVHGDVVYVLNARDGGSIQGYRRIGHVLAPIPSWHRSLGLDPAATPEFTTTPGQVLFSPGGDRLLVTTKGNTSAIDVFGVDRRGGVSARPVVTAVPGAAPFAVATFALSPDATLAPVSTLPTEQAATCWIVRVGSTLHASNAGSGTLSEIADGAGGEVSALGTAATDAGTVDAAASADGLFLYVQAGRPGAVDAFRIGDEGTLTRIGAVTVPGAAGGEGIVAVP